MLPRGPELADLVDRERVTFGTREWITSVLTNFKGHFAPLENIAADENADAQLRENASTILSGDMAGWSADNAAVLTDPANADDVKALVEFLYAQSAREDALPPDSETVQRGRAIFAGEATLASGELTSACADCHNLHVRGEAEAAFDYGSGPLLTGYGGVNWLRSFVANPGEVYGANNAMPEFASQLTEHELNMVVRWMAGDYYRPGQVRGAGQGRGE
jgi:ubiquinol-cytochrome c reductase cytochrome b subunit